MTSNIPSLDMTSKYVNKRSPKGGPKGLQKGVHFCTPVNRSRLGSGLNRLVQKVHIRSLNQPEPLLSISRYGDLKDP